MRMRPVAFGAITAFALAAAAFDAAAASIDEFDVEVPTELWKRALPDDSAPTMHARVAIAMPDMADGMQPHPVLLVSATADAGGNSSRRLLRSYADVATANGWIAVAADPADPVGEGEDDVRLRLILDMTALALLARQAPDTAQAPLAFAGFSGGAKFAGWLAAAFAHQGRTVIGVYQAGINEDTLLPAATQFDALDRAFRRMPVFLQSGKSDDVATPIDHREIAAKLKHAGFENVRIAYVDGGHRIDPAPMAEALRWFRELAARPTTD